MLYNMIHGFVPGAACLAIMFCPDERTITEGITLMWDQSVYTDRSIPANKPDLIILNKREQYCILVEISVSATENVGKALG